MNRKSLLFLCLILLTFFGLCVNKAVQAQGVTIFVSSDGSDTNCTQALPCLPADALDKAEKGDRLYFEQGIYTGTGSFILSITKEVSLFGGWNGVPTGTVILNPQTYVTIFDGEEMRGLIEVNPPGGDSTVLITGFLFRYGQAHNLGSGSRGGAIVVLNGMVQIENNKFVENYAGDYGGAIYTQSTFDVTIRKNSFTSNKVQHGGGAIYVGHSSSGDPSIIIEENQFISNESAYGNAI